MTKEKDLALRVDKLIFALTLLISSLRCKIKVEGGEAIASIPVKTLDTLESIIKSL